MLNTPVLVEEAPGSNGGFSGRDVHLSPSVVAREESSFLLVQFLVLFTTCMSGAPTSRSLPLKNLITTIKAGGTITVLQQSTIPARQPARAPHTLSLTLRFDLFAKRFATSVRVRCLRQCLDDYVTRVSPVCGFSRQTMSP
ncbi:hypothetical protein ACHWQZ_G016374 [Mnemiopsis leidyi]